MDINVLLLSPWFSITVVSCIVTSGNCSHTFFFQLVLYFSVKEYTPSMPCINEDADDEGDDSNTTILPTLFRMFCSFPFVCLRQPFPSL